MSQFVYFTVQADILNVYKGNKNAFTEFRLIVHGGADFCSWTLGWPIAWFCVNNKCAAATQFLTKLSATVYHCFDSALRAQWNSHYQLSQLPDKLPQEKEKQGLQFFVFFHSNILLQYPDGVQSVYSPFLFFCTIQMSSSVARLLTCAYGYVHIHYMTPEFKDYYGSMYVTELSHEILWWINTEL